MQLINKLQSKAMRKTKYNFMRDAGISAKEAIRMRDWTHSHIVQFIQSNGIKLKAKYEGD